MNTSFSVVLKTSANIKTQHFTHFRKAEGNRIQCLKSAKDIKEYIRKMGKVVLDVSVME